MNLIFVIKQNEIRIYSGTSQQDICPFYIGGEVIYEYEDDSFAKDLKEIILTILNDKSFENIAIHIAYTASAEVAAESILREFPPCKLVQAMCYENISDNMDVVKSFFNVSARAEVDTGMKLQIEELSQQLVLCHDERDRLKSEYEIIVNEKNNLAVKIDELILENQRLIDTTQNIKDKINRLDCLFNSHRFMCYGNFTDTNVVSININWLVSNGDIIRPNIDKYEANIGEYIISKYVPGRLCLNKFISGPSKCFYDDKRELIIEESLQFVFKGYEYTYIDYKNKNNTCLSKRIFIIKSENIKNGEVFAVITHPMDTEEAVLKWLEKNKHTQGE